MVTPQQQHDAVRPRTAWTALAGYLLVVAALTLAPQPDTGRLYQLQEVLQALLDLLPRSPEVSVPAAEQFANVLLFLPIGLLLHLALPRVPPTLLLVLMMLSSSGIELVQYVVLPNRQPSLIDVLTNTGGGAVGLVLGVDVRRLLTRGADRGVPPR
ncbi:MAG TPA: VanZ family protein [Mycobacteriales bacterium]|jgi:VanZ family protein|nr:VanZ family protein [Mycobacteriales bacterium]